MRTNRGPRPAKELEPWSRTRLLVMVGGLAIAVALTLLGATLAAWQAIGGSAQPDAAAIGQPTVLAVDTTPSRDEIATAAMPSVDPQAAFRPDPDTTPSASIVMPAPTVLDGPAGVPTGFPQTPEGAVGQWAAIEQAVLESMSLPRAREIHTAWVQPGGPGFEEWTLTHNVTSFLTSAWQGGDEKDLTTVISAAPAAALVKGSDGPSWTVACVLLDVRAWIKTESRMGYGLCARMEWIDGRWQVSAGPEPAPAPSAWPGSNAAAAAGWLTWTESAVR